MAELSGPSEQFARVEPSTGVPGELMEEHDLDAGVAAGKNRQRAKRAPIRSEPGSETLVCQTQQATFGLKVPKNVFSAVAHTAAH